MPTRKKIIHKLKQKIAPVKLTVLEKRAETEKERRNREDFAKMDVFHKKQKTIEQVIEDDERQRVDQTESTDDKTAVGT